MIFISIQLFLFIKVSVTPVSPDTEKNARKKPVRETLCLNGLLIITQADDPAAQKSARENF
jgi:hypothetical protein